MIDCIFRFNICIQYVYYIYVFSSAIYLKYTTLLYSVGNSAVTIGNSAIYFSVFCYIL
jgi:hypothetical protein